jgi:hypothetical protein
LVSREGEEGLRKFAAAQKKQSRCNLKTCYRLSSSIYGSPSANHEWEMLFQHAHVNGCGLTLSEIEPSLYEKIEVDNEDEVTGWMIENVWTDAVRYFGTDAVIRCQKWVVVYSDVECLVERIVKIRDTRGERWIGIHLLKLFSLST